MKGYTEGPVFGLLAMLNQAQRARDISGSVVEIGVHHGRLFIGMCLLQRADEPSVAVDLFDDQERNVDNSGRGDLAQFRRNVARWGCSLPVVHAGDSTQLKAGDVPEMSGARLFSVDGGHTASIVRSDMNLATNCLTPGGIVIADDVFNPQWPDVCVGTLDYLREGDLVPFAVGFNKTLFAHPEYAGAYRAELIEAYRRRYLTVPLDDKTFAGHPVVVLVSVPRTPVMLARRSETARRVVQAARRVALRGSAAERV
ncbi:MULTISPECIES: class I SAM-dependent methyltransferase [unclassified Mycobacterium]|uniref:class I SAM-dependent methyltransferase n=1 Tax=unclassified Mycobacterium TaxID=2642494 RepID=UPI0029C82D1F|nr:MULTISPECIES: class I SAM-dependent methyltransferase [unclassified Mycobacterium]